MVLYAIINLLFNSWKHRYGKMTSELLFFSLIKKFLYIRSTSLPHITDWEPLDYENKLRSQKQNIFNCY